jgi:ligand-binding SRPBCC domain-containing protein
VVPYLLLREQWIPRPIEAVFAFFADAENLEAITPTWLGFRILSRRPIGMTSGSRILYQLRWHGLPIRWLTEIETWNPPTEFADVQLRGPYRLWRHTHRFEPVNGGTRMIDEVHYALPFGLLGRLTHARLVKPALESLFDYRTVMISKILGALPAND